MKNIEYFVDISFEDRKYVLKNLGFNIACHEVANELYSLTEEELDDLLEKLNDADDAYEYYVTGLAMTTNKAYGFSKAYYLSESIKQQRDAQDRARE